jgi:purine-nucleoside phosphorylase
VRRVDDAVAFLRGRLGERPEVAIVLGTGLGAFAERLLEPVVVPYADVPHWPRPTVAGHAGRLIAGTSSRRRVLILSGRSHLYEGHAIADVVFPIRVAGALGIRTLVLTNAAGAINIRFRPGSIMAIADHINFQGANPLAGDNDPGFGPRFPDMSEVYSPRLRALATAAARDAGVTLESGVYIAVTGPSYETPAEIRAFRILGADAVGMSTVPEAIAARHMGMEVLGISCITNMAAGVLPQPLNHDEVMETARRVRGSFIALLEGIIEKL